MKHVCAERVPPEFKAMTLGDITKLWKTLRAKQNYKKYVSELTFIEKIWMKAPKESGR